MPYVAICTTCYQLGGTKFFYEDAVASAERHEAEHTVRVLRFAPGTLDPAHKTYVERIPAETHKEA